MTDKIPESAALVPKGVLVAGVVDQSPNAIEATARTRARTAAAARVGCPHQWGRPTSLTSFTVVPFRSDGRVPQEGGPSRDCQLVPFGHVAVAPRRPRWCRDATSHEQCCQIC